MRSLAALGLCGALAAALAAGPVAATSGDLVWITLGEDAFAAIGSLFAPETDGAGLPRLGGTSDVILTRVPRSALPAIAERIHSELRRCGGFVVHPGLEAAQAELARLDQPPRAPGVLPFAIDQPAWVAQLTNRVSEAELLATMTALSTQFANRYHQHPTGTAAASWIRDRWAALTAGRPDIGVTLYPSVILTILGTTRADQFVILGAHLDSIRSGCASNPGCVAPGADDDGSGVAVLTEVLRVAMAAGFRPQRTVQIMAYAAEEVGLYGSTHLASVYQGVGVDVVAMLQQDMTAYHGSTEDLALVADYTDPELTAFVGDLVDTYQPGLLRTPTTCGYACSDHAPWSSRGYRAAFVFESRVGQSNPAIHTSDDTVAAFGGNAAHAAKFARMAAAFLVETSLDAPMLLFRDGFESGSTAAWSATVP